MTTIGFVVPKIQTTSGLKYLLKLEKEIYGKLSRNQG